MRFERLTVERFGHFESLDIDLPGGPGLVVLYGPNEAGKTTLLRALHGLLFGVDERTPYAFEYDYRAIALRAVLRDSAGQRLHVTRLKKRKDSLVGSLHSEAGEVPLDGARFARYFGAITEELYRAIFGFTHADLQQGSDVLQVAGLSEILGGGALGGSAEKIRGALAGLQGEGENLFKAKGKNPAINRGLTQLRDAKHALRDAMFAQPQYAALTTNLAVARHDADAAESELARLREREARLRTLLGVFEDFHEHLGLVRALADPSLRTDLDEPAAERARQRHAEFQAADNQLRALDAELARLLARADQPAADPALLAEAGAVERLVRRVETVAEQRLVVPRERERLARETDALQSVLATMSPGTRPEDHVRWVIQPHELDRLRALATRWQRARQELMLSARGLADDEAELSALRASVAELAAAAPDFEDSALLAELEDALARKAELDREELAVARLRADLDLGLLRLHPPLPAADLAAVPLPRPADLDDHHARSLDLERERRAALSDLSREQADLARARAELAALAGADLPDLDALAAARARRDEVWQDVRRRLHSHEGFGALFAGADGADLGPDTAAARKQLTRRFERALADADDLADRLRDAADLLAKKTGLLRQIDGAEQDVARAEERVAAAGRTEARWAADWAAVWRPTKIIPGPPAAMIPWCRDAADLREHAADLVRREEVVRRLRPAIDEFTARLQRRLTWPGASLPALAQGLRERERTALAARARLEAASARLAGLESAVARGHAADAALSRELADLRASLSALLITLGLPADLEPDAALARIDALEDMSQKLANLEARREALHRGEALLAGFDAEFTALLARLGRPADDAAPEHTVDRLSRRLAEARTAAAAAAQAREQADAKQQERDALAETRAAAVTELAALAARARARDTAELLDMSERALQRARLHKRQSELALRLARALGDGPARDSYDAELQGARREALLAERDELARRISDLDRRRTGAVEQRGKLDNQLQHLGGDRAARLNAECEALHADLTQHVDRYVLVQLAQQVLARVTDRYARENQPALLHYTSDLLATITGGRHLRVVPQPEAGTLAALGREGRLRLPGELSLGTREQLFLALRLAYVLDYCDRNEPLPLVMDDVLVNFDEDRAATTLQALRDVARTTQILFLTCHRHLMHLARQTTDTGAALQIVELPGPPAATAARAADA
ncbi:AAA family ATPase [Nannocystis bainbridge]|uniref:AAA family ATPase n=1 Tax=Nannocystis bainbridge TaxID=2995303 RepID=A0ABT5DZE4_9BACT|nr:AAA family ATPase [Nannocystis bainbridge]MDC0718528.1 AAA family ATPase [Nannocystis bainbridge]